MTSEQLTSKPAEVNKRHSDSLEVGEKPARTERQLLLVKEGAATKNNSRRIQSLKNVGDKRNQNSSGSGEGGFQLEDVDLQSRQQQQSSCYSREETAAKTHSVKSRKRLIANGEDGNPYRNFQEESIELPAQAKLQQNSARHLERQQTISIRQEMRMGLEEPHKFSNLKTAETEIEVITDYDSEVDGRGENEERACMKKHIVEQKVAKKSCAKL